MSIRLTKLHLMLFFTAVMITMVFLMQQNQQHLFLNSFNKIKLLIMGPPKVVEPRPVPVIDIEAVRNNTRQIIAIAGEEMKIAKAQGRDVSEGQLILRQAKDFYEEEEYTQAVTYALQSIDEFKLAKTMLLATYTIKRGDCLWNISKRKDVYGRGAKWVKLWRANEDKIPDFDEIYSNQVLMIPRNNTRY